MDFLRRCLLICLALSLFVITYSFNDACELNKDTDRIRDSINKNEPDTLVCKRNGLLKKNS